MVLLTCAVQNNIRVNDRFGRFSVSCRKRCSTGPRPLYRDNERVSQVIQVVTAFVVDTVRSIQRDVGISVLIVGTVNARLLKSRRCQRGI